MLWSRELGDVPRFAALRAVAAAAARRADLIDSAQRSAPGHDLDLLGRLTALEPGADRVPWDGPQARVVAHDGHAPGHGAVFLPEAGVLIAGDMCSDIEIPLLDRDTPDPVGDYRAGLDRLAALTGVRQVVPGHGHVGDAAEFGRRIAADRQLPGCPGARRPVRRSAADAGLAARRARAAAGAGQDGGR